MSQKSFSNDNRLPKRITKAANILQAVKEKKESLNNLIYSEDNAHVVRYLTHAMLTHFLPIITAIFVEYQAHLCSGQQSSSARRRAGQNV
jgi:hypothetical protein